MKGIINAGFAAAGGFLGWLFGGLDGFFYALIVFMTADYFTGIMAACIEKKLSSEILFIIPKEHMRQTEK